MALPRTRAIAVDALAIVVFAIVGLISHGASATHFFRDALPLLGGWFAAAFVTRLYVQPSIPRLLVTWAVGITAGVLVRALILGRSLNGHEAAFLAVSLTFTLLFVVVLRTVASRAVR